MCIYARIYVTHSDSGITGASGADAGLEVYHDAKPQCESGRAGVLLERVGVTEGEVGV